MQTRLYPRTAQEAFKHIDPSYGQWWEAHVEEGNPWYIKLALLLCVLSCLAACLP